MAFTVPPTLKRRELWPAGGLRGRILSSSRILPSSIASHAFQLTTHATKIIIFLFKTFATEN